MIVVTASTANKFDGQIALLRKYYLPLFDVLKFLQHTAWKQDLSPFKKQTTTTTPTCKRKQSTQKVLAAALNSGKYLKVLYRVCATCMVRGQMQTVVQACHLEDSEMWNSGILVLHYTIHSN